jgi:hypothetical protein
MPKRAARVFKNLFPKRGFIREGSSQRRMSRIIILPRKEQWDRALATLYRYYTLYKGLPEADRIRKAYHDRIEPLSEEQRREAYDWIKEHSDIRQFFKKYYRIQTLSDM